MAGELFGEAQREYWKRFYEGCRVGSRDLLDKVITSLEKKRDKKPESWEEGEVTDVDILGKFVNYATEKINDFGLDNDCERSRYMGVFKEDLISSLRSFREGVSALEYDSDLASDFIETFSEPLVVRTAGLGWK